MANHVFLSVVLLACLRGCLGGFMMEKYMARNSEYNTHIKRPCAGFDLNCVRQYFANNAPCAICYGPVPDPTLYPLSVLPLPDTNMTFVVTDMQVGGLNGKIVEFYVNTQTDKVVLAVKFPRLTLKSSQVKVKHFLKGKEPITTTDYMTTNIDELTITAVLPCINNMQLAQAEISAYLGDPNPTYTMGPKMVNSGDSRMVAAIGALAKNFNNNLKEALIAVGPNFMSSYIQGNVCNFGLSLQTN